MPCRSVSISWDRRRESLPMRQVPWPRAGTVSPQGSAIASWGEYRERLEPLNQCHGREPSNPGLAAASTARASTVLRLHAAATSRRMPQARIAAILGVSLMQRAQAAHVRAGHGHARDGFTALRAIRPAVTVCDAPRATPLGATQCRLQMPMHRATGSRSRRAGTFWSLQYPEEKPLPRLSS